MQSQGTIEPILLWQEELTVHPLRQIARGSAYECAAVLDVLQVQRLIGPERDTPGKVLLVRLVAMLTKLGS